MIVLKIDVTKIDKNHLFQGKSGKYLDAALRANQDGTDQYGNDGFICQSVSKEARDKGEKGPIIGNWKHVGGSAKQKPSESKPAAKSKPTADDSADQDVPF